MKNSKIIIITTLIALVIITIVIIAVCNSDNLKNPKDDLPNDIYQDDLPNDIYQDDLMNVKKNLNPSIYKEHCLDKLCIKITRIEYSAGEGIFSFVFNNKGIEKIEPNFVNIIFYYGEEKFKLPLYYDETVLNNPAGALSNFKNIGIINAENYTLEVPTESELLYYFSKTY